MFWQEIIAASEGFMPHGHCYLWIPLILWMHVISDVLIGAAYLGISIVLYVLVRRIRLPFSPVFIAFGLFIGLCGLTHFMGVWTVWNPDYVLDGLVKVATAIASVATAIGLVYVRPQVEKVVHAARLSEERRIQLETTNAELNELYLRVKKLDEAKTRIFTNVSHELRTPLSLIVGPLERLFEDETLNVDQRRHVESIRRNGQALLAQVNDLLDVAKLESGKMEVRYERVDVACLIRAIVTRFEILAEERNIRFTTSFPAHLLAECDAEMVERIIVNLLSNAFKFTPAGGEIQIRLSADEGQMRLTIADTGPGIPLEQQKAIFERFQQSSDNTGARYGGTGLGLAIVREFTELQGGQVSLVSEGGAGASFAVQLPRRAPAGARVHETAADEAERVPIAALAVEGLRERPSQSLADEEVPGNGERATVLIVEDNAELRHFLATTLGQTYNVATATDGKDGLARALALRPDLVVTDIMMPNMSGDQLVRALRSEEAFDNTPILLLSARADDDLRVHLLLNGAQDYLVKPFLPQELVARVGNLISVKRAGDVLRTELSVASGNLHSLAGELAAKHRQVRLALDAAEVAREHAEQASQIKSRFLGLISHELRTPLSTIQMNAQLLAASKTQLPPEKFPELISRIRRSARQMVTLTEGILEYTRAETRSLEARYDDVNVVTLLDNVLSTQDDMVTAGVTLVREGAWPNSLTVATDRRLLGVVLSNLLSNALKFTESGKVAVAVDVDALYCRIAVSDTGIGIPADALGRIFEPFEQVEPIQRKSLPGVGLGLALVKEIVEVLGGQIEVSSRVGQGSRFVVALPLNHDAGSEFKR